MPEVGRAMHSKVRNTSQAVLLGHLLGLRRGTREGQRQGWRRSPLVGLRGGRGWPQSFLHLLPGKEMSVRVCLNGPSSAEPGDAATQSRYGQLRAPAVASHVCWKSTSHFTPANLHVSQVFSLFQPRVCFKNRCPCHSTRIHFCFPFQCVTWTSEASMSHTQHLSPRGPSQGQREWF